MRPKHWYHCSETYHGTEFVADRRVPSHYDPREPEVPRLCVCINVARCFAARLFSNQVYVYRTAKPRRANRAICWDQLVTRERWLVPPAPMVLVDTVPAEQVFMCTELTRQYHHATRKKSDICTRLCQLWISATSLGNMREAKRAQEYLDFFHIPNAEAHLLSQIERARSLVHIWS